MSVVESDSRVAGVQVDYADNFFEEDEGCAHQRSDLSGDQALRTSQRLAGADVIAEDRHSFSQDAVYYCAANVNWLVLVFPVTAVEGREIVVTLFEQDRAPVNRHDFKDRVEYFAL